MVTPLEAGYSVLGWNHPGFWGSTVRYSHFSVMLLFMICLISMVVASHLVFESRTPDMNSSTDLILVMARYSHKGHNTIRYHTKYHDTIQSESALPYVRTASKQATAHNTGAPSFCLSTLSPLQVPGYWPSGEVTVVGDRRRAGGVP